MHTNWKLTALCMCNAGLSQVVISQLSVASLFIPPTRLKFSRTRTHTHTHVGDVSSPKQQNRLCRLIRRPRTGLEPWTHSVCTREYMLQAPRVIKAPTCHATIVSLALIPMKPWHTVDGFCLIPYPFSSFADRLICAQKKRCKKSWRL